MSIVAIDSHSHINWNSKWDTKNDEIYKADIDTLMKINDAANIGPMFISTFSSVVTNKDIEESNEYVYKLASKNERIYQWVVIEPNMENTFLQAEKMLESKKCVGIKIHPDYHGYSIGEFGDRVFSFANERETVVLMHPQVPILSMVDFADRYPKMKVIIAHLGSVEHIEAIKKAKQRNIYTDTSGSASTMNCVLEYAVQNVGSENILFGTDTYAAGFQRGRVEYALISDSDKENILRYNAEKLFGEKLL